MMTVQETPIYPSAKITVPAPLYLAALDALKGVSGVFADGCSILLPQNEIGTIALLKERYQACVEYGVGYEYAFATRARAAAVAEELVQLGCSVQELVGLTVEQMLYVALRSPAETLDKWSTLYRASFESH